MFGKLTRSKDRGVAAALRDNNGRFVGAVLIGNG
jgi:hypothetical protein